MTERIVTTPISEQSSGSPRDGNALTRSGSTKRRLSIRIHDREEKKRSGSDQRRVHERSVKDAAQDGHPERVSKGMLVYRVDSGD
jgi:hypothetical protein